MNEQPIDQRAGAARTRLRAAPAARPIPPVGRVTSAGSPPRRPRVGWRPLVAIGLAAACVVGIALVVRDDGHHTPQPAGGLPDPRRVIALTNERTLAGHTPGYIWLWRAEAKTLSWTKERLLLEFPSVKGSKQIDYGYPWLLHLEYNRWLMFYYHGEMNGPCPLWVVEVAL